MMPSRVHSLINNNAPEGSDHAGKGTRNYCRAGKGFARVAGGAHARRCKLRDGVAGGGPQRYCIKGGRETMGRPRLPAGVWAKIAREVAANPKATQKELARKIGVSRSTVGRVMRAPQDAALLRGSRVFSTVALNNKWPGPCGYRKPVRRKARSPAG